MSIYLPPVTSLIMTNVVCGFVENIWMKSALVKVELTKTMTTTLAMIMEA